MQQPLLSHAIQLADMPQQQLLGLHPAIFQIADHIPAHAKPLAKLPLRQLQGKPHRFDPILQFRFPPLIAQLQRMGRRGGYTRRSPNQKSGYHK